MKTVDELKTYFENEIRPSLKNLEKKRILSLVKAAAGHIILFLIFGPTLIKIVLAGLDPVFAFLLLFLFYLAGTILVHVYSSYSFKIEYKKKAIEKIISFMNPDFFYDPESGIEQNEFEDSGIFKLKIDSLYSEDQITGTFNETKIRCSEVRACHTIFPGSDRERETILFNGLFFAAELSYYFPGTLFVLPDTAQKIFGSKIGRFMQNLNYPRGTAVYTGYGEFEREYAVYCDNEEKAKEITGKTFYSKILEFTHLRKKWVSLSITGSKMYIAVPYTGKLFEPRMLKSILKFNPVADYFIDLDFCFKMIPELTRLTRKD